MENLDVTHLIITCFVNFATQDEGAQYPQCLLFNVGLNMSMTPPHLGGYGK